MLKYIKDIIGGLSTLELFLYCFIFLVLLIILSDWWFFSEGNKAKRVKRIFKDVKFDPNNVASQLNSTDSQLRRIDSQLFENKKKIVELFEKLLKVSTGLKLDDINNLDSKDPDAAAANAKALVEAEIKLRNLKIMEEHLKKEYCERLLQSAFDVRKILDVQSQILDVQTQILDVQIQIIDLKNKTEDKK